MEKGFAKMLVVIVLGLIGISVVGSLLGSVRTSNAVMPNNSSFEGKTSPLLGFLDMDTPSVGNNPNVNSSNTNGSSNSNSSAPPSPISLSVSLGNGEYELQPYKEYSYITNTGSVPANITGMTLKSGKGDRPIETRENSYVYPNPEIAVIPKGAKILAASGANTLSDIVLNPGDTAYIVTGNPTPFTAPITVSFRENICTGYLASKYSFEPRLNNRCPVVADDPGSGAITKECFEYVRSNVWQCNNPEDTNLKLLKEKTTLCQSFVKSHANYPSCVALHYNDKNFYGTVWYIFLGRSKEMWGTDDSISLIGKNGKVVAKSDW